jgi:radical SAM superfamily enzyme YgiQ (UPF0313 family)
MRVVAHAVRSGIAALNVVTAALDTDPRTRDVDVVFARGPGEVARAIAAGPTVVAWSFYSPDAPRAAADLAWLRAHAPAALHVAGGVHATAEPAATVRDGFDLVIAGEGEAAFVELVAAVRAGRDPRGGPGTHWPGGAGAAAPRRPLDDFPPATTVEAGLRPDVDFLFGLPDETADDRALTIALADRLVARGARIHSHAFMPLPGTPLAGARPTAIAADVAAAIARLESRGAAYGQWRQQAQIAGELVQLRRTRPARGRPGGAGSNPP